MIRRPAVAIAIFAFVLFATRLSADEKPAAVGASKLRAPSEDKYFDSNGVKIHYNVTGKGEPVVLIHGFTGSIQGQWGLPGILAKLAKDFQVIALDNRGHGRSDKPHDPKQYGPEMIGDVVRMMDQEHVEKAHVVGYSMGGFMTSYLLMHHPDRCVTATLGGAGWSKPDDERLEFMKELAESLDAGKGIGPLITRLTPANKPKPSDEQMQSINQMLMLTNDSKALAACIRGMGGLAVSEAQLKANKVPTLCLIGGDDPLKVGVDELAAVMPNLKVEVLEGADHMTAFQRPEFVDLLKEFLTANSKTPAATPAATAAAGAR